MARGAESRAHGAAGPRQSHQQAHPGGRGTDRRHRAGSVDAILARREARVVLIGEATHGTSEFYRMRAPHHEGAHRASRIQLRRGRGGLARRGEDRHLRPGRAPAPGSSSRRSPDFRPGCGGTRRFTSSWTGSARKSGPKRALEPRGFPRPRPLQHVHFDRGRLDYLDDVDPDAARVARARYGTLTPWQRDPAAYGRPCSSGGTRARRARSSPCSATCSSGGSSTRAKDGERFFDAAQNARVVANAERYYRAMYYGSAASWNLRDTHMFDTLQALLAFRPGLARHRLGAQLPRGERERDGDECSRRVQRRTAVPDEFREDAYIIGFGTDHGTVAAASDWDEPMQRMRVRPAHPESYERLCHDVGAARVHAASARSAAPRGPRRAAAAAARARDRRGVPAGDRARQPLLPCEPAGSVRRVRLVRRDTRRGAARAPRASPSCPTPIRSVCESRPREITPRPARRRQDQEPFGDQTGREHHLVDVAMLRPGASLPMLGIEPEGHDRRAERDVAAPGPRSARAARRRRRRADGHPSASFWSRSIAESPMARPSSRKARRRDAGCCESPCREYCERPSCAAASRRSRRVPSSNAPRAMSCATRQASDSRPPRPSGSAVRRSVASIMRGEVRDRLLRGSVRALRPSSSDAVVSSWTQVMKPSSGSCCPMEGTSGRDRSMLIFQTMRRPPGPRGPWVNEAWAASASSRAQRLNRGSPRRAGDLVERVHPLRQVVEVLAVPVPLEPLVERLARAVAPAASCRCAGRRASDGTRPPARRAR